MDPAELLQRFARIDPRGLVTRNVPWKVGALAIALLLWAVAAFTATAGEEPRTFDGIPVERDGLPSGYVVRGALGSVTVDVRGAVDAVDSLGLASFKATVDLAGYDLARPGDPQELPIRVTASDQRARIVAVTPSSVAVRLVPLAEKRMTVQLRFDGQPPAGYQVATQTVDPAEVALRGPADTLNDVTIVVATVRFGDTPTDVNATFRPVPLDADAKEVSGLETDPANVSIAVALEPARQTKTVPVVPVLQGAVAPGYWLASATVAPAAVTIRGEAHVLDGIDHLATATIDVSGATADRTVRPAILLPAGTSLARPTDVLVTLSVQPQRGTRPFALLAIQPVNVGAGLAAEADPQTADAVLAGPLPALLALQPSQVVAVVDVAGRGAGTYTLDVAVRPPAGTTLVSSDPARVTVVVRQR